MGKAFVLHDLDFSAMNIGHVTISQFCDIAITATSNSITVTANKAVASNIVITISGDIVDTITLLANDTEAISDIATSISNRSINISIAPLSDTTYQYRLLNSSAIIPASTLQSNAISITATTSSISAALAHPATSNLSISVSGLGTIAISSGASTGSLSITPSTSSRTVNLAVSPNVDSTYSYNLSDLSIIIPAVTLQSNLITIVVGESLIAASAANNVATDLVITVSGDVSGTINIASGTKSGSLEFVTSESIRTANISVAPSSDSTYNYSLSDTTVNIPAHVASSNLMIVGPSAISGDVRAGNYYILDLDTMKQVVGTIEEATDVYKEYLGNIVWSINSGSEFASFPIVSGTSGNLSVLSNANASLISISATVNGLVTNKSGILATYVMTDYEISTLSDLQAIATAVNNESEASFTVAKMPGSSYVPVNGNGFSGAHFRMTNNINCNGYMIGIGRYHDSVDNIAKNAFQGVFDGANYEISNLGLTGLTAYTRIGADPVGYYGFFISYSYNAVISNIRFTGSDIICNIADYKILGILGVANNAFVDRIYAACNITYASNYAVSRYIGTNGIGTILNTWQNICIAGNMIDSKSGTVGNSQLISGGKKINIEVFGEYANNTDGSLIFGNSNNGSEYTNLLSICKNTVLPSNKEGGLTTGPGTGTWSIDNVLDITTASANAYFYYTVTAPTTHTNLYSINTYNLMGADRYQADNIITAEQAKDGTLFTGNTNWITVAGYYPIINNQYAIDAITLNRATNGYVQA